MTAAGNTRAAIASSSTWRAPGNRIPDPGSRSRVPSRAGECAAAERGEVVEPLRRTDQAVVGEEDDSLGAGAARDADVVERLALREAIGADPRPNRFVAGKLVHARELQRNLRGIG